MISTLESTRSTEQTQILCIAQEKCLTYEFLNQLTRLKFMERFNCDFKKSN